jgi:hypothetical protein
MAREPAPDSTAIFARTAGSLAQTLRSLARERGREPQAARDLTAAADAIDRALPHLSPGQPPAQARRSRAQRPSARRASSD